MNWIRSPIARVDAESPSVDSARLAVHEITRLLLAGRAIVDLSQHPSHLARRAVQPKRAVVRPPSTLSGWHEFFRRSIAPAKVFLINTLHQIFPF
jgi:hypothetical protein